MSPGRKDGGRTLFRYGIDVMKTAGRKENKGQTATSASAQEETHDRTSERWGCGENQDRVSSLGRCLFLNKKNQNSILYNVACESTIQVKQMTLTALLFLP